MERESIEMTYFFVIFFFLLKKLMDSKNSGAFRVPVNPEFATIHSQLTTH